MKPFELLSRSLGLLLKIKELALKQEELILDDQINAYLELYSQRERLQNEISANEMKYKALMDGNSHPSMEEKIRTKTTEMKDTLQSIQGIDKRIGELVAERKEDLYLEIRSLRQGQRALKGYVGGSGRLPRFINRQG